MYALSVSCEGDCYRCVPPRPGIAAAALGASESGTLPGTAPAQALHTFTLDSGALRCFFRDRTTLTPLPAPVLVRLADTSGGPVVARSSAVLPCPAVPSGSLSGLYLPSFSTNLVSTAALQDAMVTTTTPGGQRVSIRTCTRTGHHLATFTRRPGSSLYTFATEPPQNLLWHHRLGHPSLPRLRGMHSRFLVSDLPRSLPPLPPSPASPCLPCVEGRQRAAPHSSSSSPMTAPLQTLHMEVWGPARISGLDRERLFLLLVDDYTRYTTVFPLRSKGEVVDVLIPWICTVRLQLRKRFGQDLLVLRLHYDRGGEFSSNLLQDCNRGEGILQSFTLPDSPQQNGIAERCIGLVVEVARTSMIHAAAPHFLWPFAIWYAANQLNLWPRVSLPETSPTLRWTGEVGDASVFRVWGSRASVCDTSADKLSAHAIPCVFLGFVPDAPGWQFYRPTSRPPPLPSLLFPTPGPHPVDPLPPQGPAPSGVSQVDPLPGTAPIEEAFGSGAARGVAFGGATSGGAELGGAGSEGAGSGGAESGGEEPRGGEPEGVESGGAESDGAESGGAEPWGAALSRGPAGASPRLSPQQVREWLVQRARLRSGATGAGGTGDAGAGGAGVTAGAGVTGGIGAASPRCARTRGAGAAGTGGVGGAGAGDPMEPRAAGAGVSCDGGAGAGGAGVGGTAREALELRELELLTLQLEVLEALCCRDRTLFPCFSRLLVSRLLLALLLPSCVHRPTSRSRLYCQPPHCLLLLLTLSSPVVLQSILSLRLVLSRLFALLVAFLVRLLLLSLAHTIWSSSGAASALIDEQLDFAAACRLDYATVLVAESESPGPPSVEGECALGTDVLEDRQEDFECLAPAVPRFASMLLAPEGDLDAPDIPTPCSYAEAITGPYSSQWQAAMDAEMASSKSTGTYVDEVPPPGANIVDGMRIFRGVDYFQTFSPTPKMTTLRVLLDVAAQRDYELHSLDLRRPVYGLRQAPHEWHDTLETTLAALGFASSTADPSLLLRFDTLLRPFYVLVYVDDLVFATADTEALTLVKSEL
ncbi:unnamed protein product [Closterium sp. NIES-53]